MESENKNYTDPPNIQELINKLRGLVEKDEFRNFVDTHLPGWLIASTDSYSVDYPHLARNWELMCESMDVKPQKIVVVDHISFDEDHVFIKTVCDLMTARGYVVRRKEEFTGCEVCKKAIPTREVWQSLKNRKFSVPQIWSSVCSTCE